MLRRVGDTEPDFKCRLVSYSDAYEGVERTGIPMDLTGVDHATMALHPNAAGGMAMEHPMTIVLPNTLQCDVPIGAVGTYRMTIGLSFTSGRYMTVPTDDRFTVVARPNVQTSIPDPV
jgi:hypothetical protein